MTHESPLDAGNNPVADHESRRVVRLAADDHPQYLLVSGTRAMTGALTLVASRSPDSARQPPPAMPCVMSRHEGRRRRQEAF